MGRNAKGEGIYLTITEAQTRKSEEQNGLDTRVVRTVNCLL
jgi:hypothetical protein